ncbi:hypothetical protein SAY87_000882 [Trapa incisa]|uniref:BRO1 domain-containing protein n=1 Tax=Trapa incisa TaxID=236973 RepID=A0AAN7JA40_9MYRT|nr:hypothetical protein SAY87_000882 [Trapa incisa]
MGCSASKSKDPRSNRNRPTNIGDVSVYVPGIRIPKTVDFLESLGTSLPMKIIECLSAMRTHIVVMAGQEDSMMTRTRRKNATQHGGSIRVDLQKALENYLPVFLGLPRDGSHLHHKVQFCWTNQEDEAEETTISNAWYEVLSVLHLMAILLLSQANYMLLPRRSAHDYPPKVSDQNKRASIDIFLKAAGYLDCSVRQVLPQLPVEVRFAKKHTGNLKSVVAFYQVLQRNVAYPHFRQQLPVDLSEGVLRALCSQALGQAAEIQLGMAIDSSKATLAVKRRLACEIIKYWQQARDNLVNLPSTNGWGEKHHLFVKWKHLEAKAAAYYYHGMILDEVNTEKSHGLASASLQAAEEYLKESKKVMEVFHTTPPSSSSPPLWGTMKYLSEKIPKDASSKGHRVCTHAA